VLIAALVPQPALARLNDPKNQRHLREPPRKRSYQELPKLS
jgi:hypothetical protein